eukprot:gene5489-7600_t
MGNNLKPSFQNVKSVSIIEEYHKITLSQLSESFEYWSRSEFNSQTTLYKSSFDDVFSQLFNDTEVHFQNFAIMKGNLCSTYDVFCLLALLSNHYNIHTNQQNKHNSHSMQSATIKDKVQFLLLLSKDPNKSRFRIDFIQQTIFRIINAMRYAFHISLKLVNKDEIYSFVEESIRTFLDRNNNNGIANVNIDNAIFTNSLSFDQLWQCIFSSFNKSRHPLWYFKLNEFVNEKWYNDFPVIGSEDSVFSALEHIILSSNSQLPVFYREQIANLSSGNSNTNTQANYYENIQHKKTFNKGMTNNTTNNIISHRDKFEFYGAVDYYVVMCWITHNIPLHVINMTIKEEQLKHDTHKNHNNSPHTQHHSAYEVDNNGEPIDTIKQFQDNLLPSSSFDKSFDGIVPTSNRARDRGKYANTHNQWHECGEAVSFSPLKNSFENNKYVHLFNNHYYTSNNIHNVKVKEHHHNKNSIVENHNSHYNHHNNHNNHNNTNPIPFIYNKQPIFGLDQFLYNAILSFAQGHRHIPIASSHLRPNRVTHLLSSQDLISFLISNHVTILGSMSPMIISACHFMKPSQPATFKQTINFGSALYKLSKHNLDAGVIVDDHNKIISLLTAKSAVTSFWWLWYQQTRMNGHGTDKLLSLNDIKNDYLLFHNNNNNNNNNNDLVYKSFDTFISTSSSFSSFSCLNTPLYLCEALNINIIKHRSIVTPYEEVLKRIINNNNKQKENNNKELKEKNDNSDTDSSSDSSSSSNSDNDEDEDERKETVNDNKNQNNKQKKMKSSSVQKTVSIESSMNGIKSKSTKSGNSKPKKGKSSNLSPKKKPNQLTMNDLKKNFNELKIKIPENENKQKLSSPRDVNHSETEGKSPTNRKKASKEAFNSHSQDYNQISKNGDVGSPHNISISHSYSFESSQNSSYVESPSNSIDQSKDIQLQNPSSPVIPSPSKKGTNNILKNDNNNSNNNNDNKNGNVNLFTNQRVKNKTKGRGLYSSGTKRAMALAALKAQQEKEAKIKYNRSVEMWYKEMKVISPSDSILSALYLMQLTECNCVFVASPDGVPVGMITLHDICQELIIIEAKIKSTLQEQQQELFEKEMKERNDLKINQNDL